VVRFSIRCVDIQVGYDLSRSAVMGVQWPAVAKTSMYTCEEETGLEVVPEYIVGIYSNPKHVIAYANGEVRQQFSLCFACSIVKGEIQVSAESFEVAFFAPEEVERLAMHESMLQRIRDYLRHDGPTMN
jgi:hypothetical protein